MMAPQFAPAPPLRSDSPASSTSEELSSTAPKKKNSRWTETEEKILIELFGDNEEKLRYKAYNSPEWESIATQLHERCRREHVSSDKTAQQCKTKMSNLTKKYKTTKDKLRTTGYGKGGDEEADKEAEGGVELVSKVKAAAADEPTVLSFLERAQERDEAFMERMAEAERESRRKKKILNPSNLTFDRKLMRQHL